MDLATIGLSVFLGAVVQTTIIVVLYNHYIIPHIIKGVKDELMVSISGWVDEMTAALGDKIAEEIDDKMVSLKRSIAGKRGRNSQVYRLAESYLSDAITEDMDEDTKDEVLTQAAAQFTKPIVDAVMAKLWPKKETTAAAAATEEATAAGW